ncbi:MAG TPA: hypothetical protein VMV47_03535 [Bacteroidales bacterium]|nr:hypothetical protein [Bacteroidales bacterium]
MSSKLDLADPFAKKRNPWIPLIIIILIIAVAAYLLWNFGLLSKWGIAW